MEYSRKINSMRLPIGLARVIASEAKQSKGPFNLLVSAPTSSIDSYSQQLDQSRHGGKVAKIVDQGQTQFNLSLRQTGCRHQRAVFRIDIVPGNPQRGRSSWL